MTEQGQYVWPLPTTYFMRTSKWSCDIRSEVCGLRLGSLLDGAAGYQSERLSPNSPPLAEPDRIRPVGSRRQFNCDRSLTMVTNRDPAGFLKCLRPLVSGVAVV